jgi:hypothetical protein
MKSNAYSAGICKTLQRTNANSAGISISSYIDMSGSDNRYGKRDDYVKAYCVRWLFIVVRMWNIRLFAKKSIILSKTIRYITLTTKVSMIDGYDVNSCMDGTNMNTYQENTQQTA